MRAAVVGGALVWTAGLLHAVGAQPTLPSNLATASRSPARSAAANLAPVYMQYRSFTMRYDVTQPDARPFEVLFYASADRGATWTLYSKQTAALGHFLFRAARDGEYCFVTRPVTVGFPYPSESTLEAQQRVIVDTVKPKLTATAALNTNSSITIAWEAFDENLASASLAIDYQTERDQAWRSVPFERQSDATAGSRLRGQTVWSPEPGLERATIRVTVADQAKNYESVLRPVTIPSNSALKRGSQPGAANPEIPPDPFAAQSVTTDGSPKAGPPSAVDTDGRRAPQGAANVPAPGTVWPSDRTDRNAFSGSDTNPPRPAPAAGPAIPPAPVAQPVASSGAADARWLSDHPSPAAKQPEQAGAGSGPAASPPSTIPGRPEDAGLPPGERPRMTRFKSFNLDYSLDAVPQAGVEKVELWMTRNGGHDWDLYGKDDDRESPFLVENLQEGLYGFRIVIVGNNGLASQTPRSGDLADLWVCVDTTAPVAEITAAAYGSGDHSGQLDIRWKALDAHLGSRPVTLSFTDNPAGTWSTIGSGLPNTGQHYWRVDARIPDKFYLRLEVRDEAGNVTTHQLSEPITSAGLVPQGRIQGLEPIAK
jgi:hypothetical protein